MRVPSEPSAALAQAAIAEEFSYFSDWSERYQYLIDLGRKLPPFPESLKTEANRLHGCQSMVWIVGQGDADEISFQAISDSSIVSGLIHLALRVYSGRSAAEILATPPD
ncbi:MAG: SufE family protein, partial [Arenimonas sp.]|nr:SufE family protein [Arenimonas sp.]